MWRHREAEPLPTPETALAGRANPTRVRETHFVNGSRIVPPFPADTEEAWFGMGCFWGAERGFWQTGGVHTTAAGYAGGITPNPTYEEVCTGRTGHAEVVRVVYRPEEIDFDHVLRVFWEGHDPTQGHRQGNDVGSQYRSAVYTTTAAQLDAAVRFRDVFQHELTAAGYGAITTEIAPAREFFYAEDYHQQYLGKNPNGYCGLGGTGVACPTGLG
jgi:peptide-methionine (S)-S-oxide reductase